MYLVSLFPGEQTRLNRSCASSICQNGGVCTLDVEARTHFCQCTVNYQGKFCETRECFFFLVIFHLLNSNSSVSFLSSRKRVHIFSNFDFCHCKTGISEQTELLKLKDEVLKLKSTVGESFVLVLLNWQLVKSAHHRNNTQTLFLIFAFLPKSIGQFNCCCTTKQQKPGVKHIACWSTLFSESFLITVSQFSPTIEEELTAGSDEKKKTPVSDKYDNLIRCSSF